VKLYAYRVGTGAPIVCVHGIGVTGAYFLPLARALAEAGRRAVVPDLPGWGRSPRPPRALDVCELADALLAFLDQEQLDRVPLVANSMGCQIVLELAVRSPERVASLVLVGPTVDPHWRSVRQQVPRFVLDCVREPPSLLAIIALDYATFGPLRFVATARAALRDRPEEKLPRVDVPALVVRGERDGFVSQRWCEDAARLLPRGRLVVVRGVAHAAHYAAAGRVAELVREELEQRV
jgi:pimeloyl-ACP methyl ester carboxylesterase